MARPFVRGLLVVAGLWLAACGGGSSGGRATINVWVFNEPSGSFKDAAKRCSQASNGQYKIVLNALSNNADQQRQSLVRRLAAKDSSIDIAGMDVVWTAEFAAAGWIKPWPTDLANQVKQGTLPGPLATATYQGKLYAAPANSNTQLLWYRKSVAEAAGLDMTQPVTWDQIIQAAEDQDKKLGVQGALAESLTVWINALVASAGGKILEDPDAKPDEMQLGLDTDAGKKAADIINRIGASGLGGSGLPTADENASMNLFQGDDGSFMVNWPFVYPAMQGAAPEVVDDLGWAVYPRVDAGTPAAPPVGGINLGVGAYSAHTDLAWQAVACIVSPENQAQYFVTNGNPPSNAAAYDDPEVQEKFPMADTIKESLDLGAPRPQTPYYNEISIGLQRTWHPPTAVSPDSTPQTSTDFILAVLRGERLL